ncbi:MAG: hypothetical protein IMF05_14825 [Proteobacteria bacterium]|nr:hypothetical protein [Pseudomonadota bacterium]
MKNRYGGSASAVLAAAADKEIQHAVPSIGAAGEYRAIYAETVDQGQRKPRLFPAVVLYNALVFIDHRIGFLCLLH